MKHKAKKVFLLASAIIALIGFGIGAFSWIGRNLDLAGAVFCACLAISFGKAYDRIKRP